MQRVATGDGLHPTVDVTTITVDQGFDGVIRPIWPCMGLADDPPSVFDRQAEPSADDLLPQVLSLTPRGPAWGTDEAGDGSGASPIMRRVWRAVAAWAADLNRRDWLLATQAFPSAITDSLAAWEEDLGLPDPCFRGGAGTASRVAAVRARFGARGGQAPAYFICLAASIGYSITIEEPTQFLVDVSALGEDPIAEGWFLIDNGEVSQGVAESWFLIDESEVAPASIVAGVLQPGGDGDPIEGFALGQEGDGTRLESFTMPGSKEYLDTVSDETVWKYWIVNVLALGESWFFIDDGEVAYTPLEGFQARDDLECLLNRYALQHTKLVFSYALSQ